MRRSHLLILLILSVPLVAMATANQTTQDAVRSTTFHHVHLNSADPSAAADFYTRTFDVTKKTSLAGFLAIQSEKIFLLLNQAKPAVSPSQSAIWHFGWGSTGMEEDYAKHLANGVVFQTPITKLGSGLLFAYMKAPDGALVEINTSNTRGFIHVHLYSDAPLCAADWYVKNLGATTRSTRERAGPCEVPFAAPSEPLGVIRSPSASVRFGEISLIIYPRQRPGAFVSPRGQVVDHIALGVSDLTSTLERLRKAGVKVLNEPRNFGTTTTPSAFIEGPDSIAIELIQDEAK